jgi:CheY-like chemotaxis protein
MSPIRGCRTGIQADIDDPGSAPPLVALDRVLDGLLTVLHESAPDRIAPAARGYVEDAIGAAMAAAVRARDNDLAGSAAGPIAEAAAVARALLAELRGASARSEALVNRSLELRRQAIRLTATALTLRRQPRRGDQAPASLAPHAESVKQPREATDGLHGVRVLVVGDSPALVEKFTMLLSALGADVRAASALREAAQDARVFDPDALLCELPANPDRARALADELGRQGLGLPTVAITAATDAATRDAGLRAGFVDVLAGPVTFSDLADAIRRAIVR